MIKCVTGLIIGLVMLTGTATQASDAKCEGKVCRLAKTVVAAPVNLVREAQPVKLVVSVPVRATKWVASHRPVRSLFGRVAKCGCCK